MKGDKKEVKEGIQGGTTKRSQAMDRIMTYDFTHMWILRRIIERLRAEGKKRFWCCVVGSQGDLYISKGWEKRCNIYTVKKSYVFEDENIHI